jgi:hypothetical protein
LFALLDAIHFGGVEEMGGEFGHALVGANGAAESVKRLGEIVGATAITGEVAQAGMVWAPVEGASGWPARRAAEAASSTVRRFYQRFTFSLPAGAGVKVWSKARPHLTVSPEEPPRRGNLFGSYGHHQV